MKLKTLNKIKMHRHKSNKINTISVQFSSATQSCLTLCHPIDRSTPGLPSVLASHHQLPEFTHLCPSSQWCHPTILSSVIPFSSCLQSFPASEARIINRQMTKHINDNKTYKFLGTCVQLYFVQCAHRCCCFLLKLLEEEC